MAGILTRFICISLSPDNYFQDVFKNIKSIKIEFARSIWCSTFNEIQLFEGGSIRLCNLCRVCLNFKAAIAVKR